MQINKTENYFFAIFIIIVHKTNISLARYITMNYEL